MLEIITTKRRLAYAIQQLWAKCKATFSIIGHKHPTSDITGLQSIVSQVQQREVINCTAVDYIVASSSSATESGKTYASIADYAVYAGGSTPTKIADIARVAGRGIVALQESSDYRFVYFVVNGSSVGGTNATPNADIIYAAVKYKSDGTTESKIYRYNSTTELFEDVAPGGGGYVDGRTIFVNNLTTDLADYDTPGMYNVVYSHKEGFGRKAVDVVDCYTFVIDTFEKYVLQGSGLGIGHPILTMVAVLRQTLMNKDGYLIRTKEGENSWGEWGEFNYAFSSDIQSLINPYLKREVFNCIAVDYCIDDRSDVDSPVSGKTYYSISDEAVYKGDNSSLVKIADYEGVIGNGVIMLEECTEDYEHKFIIFFDEDGDIGTEVGEPDSSIIYSAVRYNIDGTTESKIYRYNDTTSLFEDVAPDGGGYVDGRTIYVNNLTTDLADYDTPGMYNVVYSHKEGFGRKAVDVVDCYTFVIDTFEKYVLQGSGLGIGHPILTMVAVLRQTLMNKDGYLIRTKEGENSWGEWGEFNYAFSSDIERVEMLARKAIKLAKGAY